MVDATKRKLQVPARFVPYMETHRIHELFHDLTSELVVRQPDDHISFMKETLERIMHCRDRPRVVLIAPPEIDKMALGQLISNFSGVICITTDDIMAHAQAVNEDNEEFLAHLDYKIFAVEANKLLRNHQFVENGWILIDLPNDSREANALVQAGILPTHTFQLTLKSIPVPKVHDYVSTCKKPQDPDLIADEEIHKNYERNLIELLEVYHQSLTVIDSNGRSLEDIATSISRLINVRNLYNRPPMLPRILLIGPLGSGKKTQASLLCEKFNLIHVELEELLARTRQEQNSIGDMLLQYERNGNPITPEFLITIIERRILKADCKTQGWVMTSYPRNSADFRLLDHTTTPPNRVIFLNIPMCECMVRLAGRRFNMYTGTENHLSRNPPLRSEMKYLKIQPKDNPQKIIAVHNEQITNVRDMEDYAGNSAVQVDGRRAVLTVHEVICDCVMKPSLCVEPREGNFSKDSDSD